MIANDNDQVLVIRFWQEREVKELQSLAGWRARITYVNSGQLFYASGMDDAFAVVRSVLLAAQRQDGEPS
jgi:hypothetical protein